MKCIMIINVGVFVLCTLSKSFSNLSLPCLYQTWQIIILSIMLLSQMLSAYVVLWWDYFFHVECQTIGRYYILRITYEDYLNVFCGPVNHSLFLLCLRKLVSGAWRFLCNSFSFYLHISWTMLTHNIFF